METALRALERRMEEGVRALEETATKVEERLAGSGVGVGLFSATELNTRVEAVKQELARTKGVAEEVEQNLEEYGAQVKEAGEEKAAAKAEREIAVREKEEAEKKRKDWETRSEALAASEATLVEREQGIVERERVVEQGQGAIEASEREKAAYGAEMEKVKDERVELQNRLKKAGQRGNTFDHAIIMANGVTREADRAKELDEEVARLRTKLTGQEQSMDEADRRHEEEKQARVAAEKEASSLGAQFEAKERAIGEVTQRYEAEREARLQVERELAALKGRMEAREREVREANERYEQEKQARLQLERRGAQDSAGGKMEEVMADITARLKALQASQTEVLGQVCRPKKRLVGGRDEIPAAHKVRVMEAASLHGGVPDIESDLESVRRDRTEEAEVDSPQRDWTVEQVEPTRRDEIEEEREGEQQQQQEEEEEEEEGHGDRGDGDFGGNLDGNLEGVLDDVDEELKQALPKTVFPDGWNRAKKYQLVQELKEIEDHKGTWTEIFEKCCGGKICLTAAASESRGDWKVGKSKCKRHAKGGRMEGLCVRVQKIDGRFKLFEN